ncbi:MAG: MFS transporter [Chloroflexota bacterium]
MASSRGSNSAGNVRGKFFYGWVIVAASSLTVFAATATAPPLFTMFITPMALEFGWSRTLIAGALSFGTVVAALVSPVVGRLVDRYGARWVIAGAVVLFGGALGSLSQVSSVISFYLGFGLSRAIGQSVMDQGSTLSVANWFARRRARALSFINVGRGIGACTMPMLAYAAISNFGWRAGWIAVGCLVVGVAVLPAAVFLRRRPEDMGLTPDGVAATPSRQSSANGAGSAGSVNDAPEPFFALRDARKTIAFWLLATAMFIRGVCTPGIAVHLMPYLLSREIDPSRAVVVVSLYAACLAVGGLLWGAVAQRAQVRHCLAGSLACAALAVAFLLTVGSATEGLIYAVVMGANIGGVFTLEPAIWATYFGRVSLGAIYGAAMAVLLVGIALGPIISGLSFDLLGSYQAAFCVFSLGYALCAVVVFLSRPPSRIDAGSVR